MSEEYVSRKICDRCGKVVEQTVQKGVIGVKRANYPEGWEHKENVMHCKSCLNDYYVAFKEHMEKGKQKKKE